MRVSFLDAKVSYVELFGTFRHLLDSTFTELLRPFVLEEIRLSTLAVQELYFFEKEPILEPTQWKSYIL